MVAHCLITTFKRSLLFIWCCVFVVVKTSIAFPANHLVGVVLLGHQPQSRLDYTTTKTQHQMKGRLLLNVVIRQCTTILELFSSKNQTLLVWRNTFLVLDLSLDIFDGVRGLDLQSDGLTSECLDENLHLDASKRR